MNTANLLAQISQLLENKPDLSEIADDRLGQLISYLEQKENGKYLIIIDKFFSIIEIQDGDVKYLLNKVHKV